MTKPLFFAALALCIAGSACAPQARQPSPTTEPIIVTTTAPATTTTTLSVEDATAAFHGCLGRRGVVISPIPFDSQGRPRLELAMVEVDFSESESVQALTECSDILADGALELSIWPELQEQVQELLSEFTECVRSRGVVAFPDPIRPFTGVGGPYPLEEIPFDDPELEAAVDACGSRLAEPGS